ncbi:MAG: alpha/beta hydrolase fold domain-containing protein [Pseudoxanthomonas sp.]
MSSTSLFAARRPSDLADLVREQPLAWIVTGHAGALGASVLPVQLECDENGRPLRVLGHFGRNNPQVQALAQDPRATILLLGPHGYVSVSWFGDRTRAPTWNYTWAVFDVEVELRDTPEGADALLESLTAQLEADRPAAWRTAEMGERYHSLSKGIVGFHAHVKSVRSTFKLGQDERDDVFADILSGLDILGQTPLSEWMRRFGADRPLPQALPPPATLDPEIAGFIDDVRAEWRRLAAGRELDWPARRELAEITRMPWRQGGPQMADTREVIAQTEVGPVRLRIHHPVLPGQPRPTLLFMHGGGWAMFSIDTHDRVMREYAAASGCAVVGVEYALAPEVRYPVALNQVVGVVRWLKTHGAQHGLDPQRLALGGDSAGGNLSFGAALKLRDAGEADAVKAILSIYGGSTPDCSPASLQRYGTPQDMLTGEEVRVFWNNYIGHVRDKRDPYLAVQLADLRGLPPTYLVIGECDVLAEQNLQMAGSLLAAGVKVKAKVYPGAPHSFIEAVAVSATAREAVADGAQWLRQVLGNPLQ